MYNWNYGYKDNKNINNYKNIFNNVSGSNTTIPDADKTKQNGFLDITVFNEAGVPMESAIVTVFILDRFAGESPIQIAMTDVNGKAPTFTIPTAYYLKQTIGINYYFTSYNIRVEAIGYYSYQVNNVHFYEGITTTFIVNLQPIPLKVPEAGLEQRLMIPPSKFEKIGL